MLFFFLVKRPAFCYRTVILSSCAQYNVLCVNLWKKWDDVCVNKWVCVLLNNIMHLHSHQPVYISTKHSWWLLLRQKWCAWHVVKNFLFYYCYIHILVESLTTYNLIVYLSYITKSHVCAPFFFQNIFVNVLKKEPLTKFLASMWSDAAAAYIQPFSILCIHKHTHTHTTAIFRTHIVSVSLSVGCSKRTLHVRMLLYKLCLSCTSSVHERMH